MCTTNDDDTHERTTGCTKMARRVQAQLDRCATTDTDRSDTHLCVDPQLWPLVIPGPMG
jgi:hypothetical protein